MTAAITDPVSYVRMVASLMPRELEATATVVHADRMSDDELAAIACQGGENPLATEEDEETFQPVEQAYGVEPAPHHRLLMSRLMPALGLNVPPTVLERADD